MKRKLFSMLLALVLCVGLLPMSAFAEGTTGAVTGKITQGCMATVETGKVRLAGELNVTNTGDELQIKLYSGETLIATTTLGDNYKNKTDYANSPLTWYFSISGTGSSWKTVWEDGMPRSDYKPTKVELYVDGAYVDKNGVTMYKNNDEVPGEEYAWEALEGVHKIVIDAAVAPTCTSTGLTEGSHCSCHDNVYVAQEVIAATNHTVVVDKAVAATYESTGLTEGSHCSVCGEVIVAQKEIAKLVKATNVSDGTATDNSTSGKVPKTGDDNNMIMWAAVMLASVGSIAVSLLTKKNRVFGR